MDVDVKAEKAKLQRAEQKLEELFAKHAAQTTRLAHAERALAEKEKEWQEKLRDKEEGFEKERSVWQLERERGTQDSGSVDAHKLKEVRRFDSLRNDSIFIIIIIIIFLYSI